MRCSRSFRIFAQARGPNGIYQAVPPARKVILRQEAFLLCFVFNAPQGFTRLKLESAWKLRRFEHMKDMGGEGYPYTDGLLRMYRLGKTIAAVPAIACGGRRRRSHAQVLPAAEHKVASKYRVSISRASTILPAPQKGKCQPSSHVMACHIVDPWVVAKS
jgi:hypothetical protein